MPKLAERGVAHILFLLLLVVGLVAGVYLITQQTPFNFLPKASLSKPTGPEVSFTLVGPSGCTAGILCIIYGQHALEEEFEVKLYARSDIETANLFTAKITFPKDIVEIKELKKDGSFVENWVEEFYDNSSGEISLVGGVADPGYQTTVGQESALMATLVFRTKALGKGTVSFKDSSEILSNLNNINILTTTRPYDISITVKPSPTPSGSPWSAVALLPPPDSATPNASGTVTVSLKENDLSTGYITVEISGSLKALTPNTEYGVWLCSKDGTSCGTKSGDDYPTIITDAQGDVYHFSGLKIVRREDPNNPNSYIKVYDWGGGVCTVEKPCLIGSYSVPKPSPTPLSPCRQYDGNVKSCDNSELDCAYYYCSNQCWPTGTDNAIACPPATREVCAVNDGNVTGCDATSGCAYYTCSNQCWPTGTDNSVACPPKGDGNKDGKVNLIDMSILHTDWKADINLQKAIRDGIDMNNDGLVNTFDFSALRDMLATLGVIKVR